MNPRDHVATNVRTLRNRRGWSLATLSEQLAELDCSMSLAVLSNMEKGDRGIDVDELVPLAEVLGVTPTVLLEDPDRLLGAETEHLQRERQRLLDERARLLTDHEAALATLHADLDRVLRQLVEAMEGRGRADLAVAYQREIEHWKERS